MAESERETDLKQAETGYKVTDRRPFTAEGELRPDAVQKEEEPRAEPLKVPAEPQSGRDPGFDRRPIEEPEGVDFTMLINAMAEPALLFLGEIPHPGTGQPEVDVERSRIQIDMLDLLRVKCRGNLTPGEEGLLDRVLYQLRMLYVSRANQPAR